MNKTDAIKKLEAAGIDAETIAALTADADESPAIIALKAKLVEAEGKANGILGDKKKHQQKVEELQAKLDELEGKDLGEAGKLKLEMERMKARLEKAEKDKTDLEGTYQTEKRNAELSKLQSRLKFLDTVPEDARGLLIASEFKDLTDLGNTVLVDERLKAVQSKYNGLLAATVPNGAGTKAGQGSQTGNRPNLDAVKSKSLTEIAKDPKAYVASVMAAAESK